MTRFRSWPSAKLVAAIATVAAGATGAFGLASTATADVTKDGWGLFIADDNTSFYTAASSAERQAVSRLRPKVFRFQTIWNTVDRPYWDQRAHDMIAAAKARGVERIIVTIRSNNPANVDLGVSGSPSTHDPGDYFPSYTTYKAKVGALVTKLNGKVDYWGPANEPNGDWRPADAPGGNAQLDEVYLAAYFKALKEILVSHNSAAKLMSPDFLDSAGFTTYIEDYLSHLSPGVGDGWGEIAAWHPYRAVKESPGPSPGTAALWTTNHFADLVPSGKPIWVTEVGAHLSDRHMPANTIGEQNAEVDWIVNKLGSHDRISRIAYYQPPGGSWDWDTGLLNPGLSPRPAWQTWCAATHSGDGSHADCVGYPPADTLGVHSDGGGNCLINANATNNSCDLYFAYGGPGDQAIVGDWNGDGIDTLGVYSDTAGAACLSNQNGAPCATYFQFGGPGDEAVVGDWNGDGIDTLGVHNDAGGNCLINANSTNNSCDSYFTFGSGSQNQAIAGDWDGDGIDTLGVHSDGGGNCLINVNSTNNSCNLFFTLGGPGDEAVVGDWDGDGNDTLGVHNDAGGNCLINVNSTNSSCDLFFTFGGGSQNQAIAGNWGP